jgi:hypothetical protein
MLSRSKYVIFLLHAFACLCAVQVIIWIGNYAYRHQETPVRNFNSVENKIDQIRYDGTPKMRRKLAEVGEEAVQNDMWIQMTKSIMEREKTIDKMYALHVSKSGGTSLCDTMKLDKCFIPQDAKRKANCWSYKYRSKQVDLGTKWVRHGKVNGTDIVFKNWVYYNESRSPSSTCLDIRNYLVQNMQTLAMSENWLPKGGVCQHGFLNVIVLRNPLERLRSHYQHLYDECIQHSSPGPCALMLNEDKSFNIDFMNRTFDIITDNYNVRSLNEQAVYKEPTGFDGKGQIYLENAIENLSKFDWVLIVSAEKENDMNKIILEDGVGLSHGLPVSRKRNKRRQKNHFNAEDKKRIRKMNSLDLKLWREAKRIHKLDLISLRMMRKFSPTLWNERQSIKCAEVPEKDAVG